MINRIVLLATASALLTIGCGQPAAVTEQPAKYPADGMVISAHVGPDTLVTPNAQGFANATAAADRFAIESAKLAASNAQSPALKAFASKMLTSHSSSTGKLRATVAGIAPTITLDEATLTAEQQRQIDVLRDKRGAEFDRDYSATQITALETSLNALEAYAAVGDNASLAQFAKEMIPGVTALLKVARTLP